ncbi:hypothetical protein PRUPE_2G316700 [Prunus persica]|uniref:Uncharacterized protein n=1 Tax=Prunus persica TaxID=3760 RepID=A0A251QSQ2_PRUPE|nr:hypothetical protein PRUPE_2G316700 [Prunus persica]
MLVSSDQASFPSIHCFHLICQHSSVLDYFRQYWYSDLLRVADPSISRCAMCNIVQCAMCETKDRTKKEEDDFYFH